MIKQFEVLLFYKYVFIKNPEALMSSQKKLCEKLGIKGRIIISTEGINGTLEGTTEVTTVYCNELQKDKRFCDINFKKSTSLGVSFPRLSVKVRNEIVSSSLTDLKPTKLTGKYISAETLYMWFQRNKEFYIVDMRNDYEYISGHFKGSILSGFHNFKDLPSVIEKLNHLRDKTIVTVCTGGVRCEKASAFLLVSGFMKVYQLENGIHDFMEKYPNEYFQGKLYVFDNRLTIGFNTEAENHIVVGKCMHCNTSCDTYVNCMNHACHLHFISCFDCLDKKTKLAFCKEECKEIYFNQEGLTL